MKLIPYRETLAPIALLMLALAAPAAAASAPDYQKMFQAAERFMPSAQTYNLRAAGRVEPHWIGGGSNFWYVYGTGDAAVYVEIDPLQATQRTLFTGKDLAVAIAAVPDRAEVRDATVIAISPGQGTTRQIEVAEGERRWKCVEDGAALRCNAGAIDDVRPDEVASPDGKWRVLAADYNLYLRRANSQVRKQLTFDGQKDFPYGIRDPEYYMGPVTRQIMDARFGAEPPEVKWSADSKRILILRKDQRYVRDAFIIHSSPKSRIPRLYTYKRPLAGDQNIGLVETAVINVETGTAWRSQPMVNNSVYAGWLGSGNAIWISHYARGSKEALLGVYDLDRDGAQRWELSETADHAVQISPHYYRPPLVAETGDGNLLRWSERDGWGHLYLIDGRTGKWIRQVTSGAWPVQRIISVDPVRQEVYFIANGCEPGRDAYYDHLYRASYRTPGKATLLTPEDANHQESESKTFSPDHNVFVDSFSTVDTPARSVLRTRDGRMVMALPSDDGAKYQPAGWRAPERVRLKAADGKTDIYAVIYKPSFFDPARTYPVVDNTYPGMFRSFSPVSYGYDEGEPQAMAELGAIVVMIDGRGTSNRSRAFRDFGYGTLGFAGLADHVAGINQLARARAYIDTSRVGIYGLSAGGDATIWAMLHLGDFFKVGVADGMSGPNFFSHVAEYGEVWIGDPVKERAKWDDVAAETHIAKLRGKLLLLHGEADDHGNALYVHQLVDRALDADVAIDEMFIPNMNHGEFNLVTGDPKTSPIDRRFNHVRWRYFIDWLGLDGR